MQAVETRPQTVTSSVSPSACDPSLRETTTGEVSLQPSSPFFKLLPPELRLIIYHYVPGGYAVHFIRLRYESSDPAVPRHYIKMVLLEKIALADVKHEPYPDEEEGFRDRDLLECYNCNYDNTNCILSRFVRNGGRHILLSLLKTCKIACDILLSPLLVRAHTTRLPRYVYNVYCLAF